MADVTLIAVAAITGGTGVAGGYIAARRQAASAAERQLAEHREDERRRVGDEYHRLLDHVSRFNPKLRPLSEAAFDEWIEEFHHCANGVRLFGTREVVLRVIEIVTLVDLFGTLIPDPEEWDLESEFPPFEYHLSQAFQTFEDKWFATHREMVAAMRADVSIKALPGERPIEAAELS